MDNHRYTRWGLLVLVAIMVVALGVVAAGCGSSATTTTGGGAAGELAADQTLRVNINTEPPNIDPNLGTDTTSAKVINNIFEGLTHINYEGEVFPGAAEKWEVSDDGLTYTFYLRGTDKWTNGDVVTSQDFKDSWLILIRLLGPTTPIWCS